MKTSINFKKKGSPLTPDVSGRNQVCFNQKDINAGQWSKQKSMATLGKNMFCKNILRLIFKTVVSKISKQPR